MFRVTGFCMHGILSSGKGADDTSKVFSFDAKYPLARTMYCQHGELYGVMCVVLKNKISQASVCSEEEMKMYEKTTRL